MRKRITLKCNTFWSVKFHFMKGTPRVINVLNLSLLNFMSVYHIQCWSPALGMYVDFTCFAYQFSGLTSCESIRIVTRSTTLAWCAGNRRCGMNVIMVMQGGRSSS